VQTYLCKACTFRFSGRRRKSPKRSKKLWSNYVFGKQTVKQLSASFGADKRSVRASLKQYVSPTKKHHPRPIHLVVDATYFGKRKEGTSWCAIVARDPYAREDLLWSFEETETTSGYAWIKDRLEELGYTILSVTADGFPGIKSAFHGIPFQMCHVHMERLIVKGTTKNPLTEAGRVLLALVRTLHQKTNSHLFHARLKEYVERYRDFLNEKTIHPFSEEESWTHEDLRRAVYCLMHHEKYLFTYEHNHQIPKTTNSLEGHFRHVKKLVHMHHGASKQNAQHILDSIFLASTTSPNKKQLDELL
jgi:Transposase IS66 family